MAVHSSERGFVTTTDRIPLYYRMIASSGEADGGAAVVILHGYGEHSGRYGHVMEPLAAAGFDCLALDFRGHGQSGGRRGHVLHFEDYLDDVTTAVSVLRRHRSTGQVYLLGHSQGALVALLYLAERGVEVAGAVACSPMLAWSMPVPAWKAGLAGTLTRFTPGLSFANGVKPSWLSRDAEVVQRYRIDPLVHHVATVRWFTEAKAAQLRLFREAGAIRQPVFLLQGGADRIVSAEATRRLFGRLAMADKQLRMYDDHYHELLNEPGGREVLGEVVAWLQHRAAP